MNQQAKSLNLALLLLVLVAAAPSPLLAQTSRQQRPDRPYRGLFGSRPGNVDQSLVFTGSLLVGYGQTARDLQTLIALDQEFDASRSTFGGLTGGLGYSLQRDRFNLDAGVGTSLRYFTDAGQTLSAHQANVGGGISLTQRTQLSVAQSVAYSPYYLANIFPTLAVIAPHPIATPDLDVSTLRRDTFQYDSTVGLTQTLSSRSSLSASYARQSTDFGVSEFDFTSQSASLMFNRRLTKYASLRLGYTAQEGRYGRGEESDLFRGHTVNAGVDYNRPLSLSRKTTLSFGAGSTAINDRHTTFYTITGNVGLDHAIGRSWSAAASFNRDVTFLAAFAGPFLSDSVTAGVGGMISRRLELNTSAGYSTASGIGVGHRDDGFKTYSGSAGVLYGLNRFLAVSLDYSYYRYDFGGELTLLPGLSRELNRHSISAGLNLSVPLYTRTRRTRVTR